MLHRILDGFPLAALDDLSSSWQMIGVEGEWKGHAMGSFKLNRAIFEEIIQNFQKKSIETVVDYEHASVFGAEKAIAAGWVSALEIKEIDGKSTLWAKISWTENAEKYIKANEYRYLSPTFQWKSKDRETGKMIGAQLHSVAVTNRPFLHELDPIRLNSLMDSEIVNNNDNLENKRMDEKILKALGLEEGEEGQALAKIEKLKSDLESLLKETGKENPAAACGEIMRLKNPAVSEEEILALREENAALKKEKLNNDAASAVKKALEEGKLTAEGTKQHDWALAYALKDLAGFGEWADAAPKVVPVEKAEHSENKQEKRITLSHDELDVARSIGLTAEEFLEAKKMEENR